MKKNINKRLLGMPMKRLMVVVFIVIVVLMATGVHAYSLSYDSAKPVLNMSYDENNRVLSQGNTTEWVKYVYDGTVDGTLTNVSTSKGVVTRYTYDDRKRVTSEVKFIDGYTFRRNITYDSQDRATSLGGSGALATRSYGNNGLVNAIVGLVNFFYNERGQPLSKSYNNNLTSSFSYNQNTSRVTEIKTGSVQDMFYGYDAYGNIVSINDTINLRNMSLTYDGLHRLIFADVKAQENSYFNYTYNSLGNILIINSTSDNIVYAYTTLAHAPTSISGNPVPLLNISSLNVVYANLTERIVRFVIQNNNLTSSFSTVGWNLTTGNGNVSSTTNIVLTAGKDIFVYVYHNYTASGNYTAQVTAQGGGYTVVKSIPIIV